MLQIKTNIMQELLEYIATKILPHPDDIHITERVDDEGSVRLTLVTHPEDTGLAIGKGGKTAHAIREILKIKAIQEGKRVYLDIRSPEEMAEQTKAKEKAVTKEQTAAKVEEEVTEE